MKLQQAAGFRDNDRPAEDAKEVLRAFTE